MDKSWLMQIVSDRWFIAVTAFCLGILTGWIVWARHKIDNKSAPLDHEKYNQQPLSQFSRKQQETLADLVGELENAQQILEDSRVESDTYKEILKNLDEAVKRANGRLKLIVKSIKRQ